MVSKVGVLREGSPGNVRQCRNRPVPEQVLGAMRTWAHGRRPWDLNPRGWEGARWKGARGRHGGPPRGEGWKIRAVSEEPYNRTPGTL